MNVATGRIGDIADQIRGVTYRKQDASNIRMDGCLPVLRAGNITDEGLTYVDLVYVPSEKVSAKQKVRKNDIVVAASSGSIGVVGKAARALEDFDGGFGAFCKVLRPSKKVDPAYFAQFFKTPQYRRKVSFLAAGANINNLRNEDLDDLEIPLPPLAEQKRIAGILDAADALRAKRRESLAQLDSLLQSTFLDMFGDPVINPKSWKLVGVADLCETENDVRCGPFGTQLQQHEFTVSGVPLWGIKHVNTGFRALTDEFVTAEKAEKLKAYSIVPRDLVMTRKGTIGNCHIYPDTFEPGLMHSDLLRLRLSPQIAVPEYIWAQFVFSRKVQRQLGLMSTGAVMPGINVSKLKKLLVELPPLSLQRRFATVVVSVERQKARMRAHLAELDTLFASLQYRGFNRAL